MARPGRPGNPSQFISPKQMSQVRSNGPTEAINGVIQTTRRITRGFRNFTNFRLRCPLAAGGHRPYRIKQTNDA